MLDSLELGSQAVVLSDVGPNALFDLHQLNELFLVATQDLVHVGHVVLFDQDLLLCDELLLDSRLDR